MVPKLGQEALVIGQSTTSEGNEAKLFLSFYSVGEQTSGLRYENVRLLPQTRHDA